MIFNIYIKHIKICLQIQLSMCRLGLKTCLQKQIKRMILLFTFVNKNLFTFVT